MTVPRVAEVSGCYNRRMTERTLAIIKPDAVERRLTGRIIQRIEDAGFQIRAMRRVHCLKQRRRAFTPCIASGRFSAA